MQQFLASVGTKGFMPAISPTDMQTFTPKAGMYEYLLVANTNSEIEAQLMAEKESFSKVYQQNGHNRTKPHITIARFTAAEHMENTIAKWIQRICAMQQSFAVTFNNYSGFPSGTIYLRVLDAQPFEYLARQLRVVDNYITGSGLPAAKLMTNPRFTIASKLPEEVYTKAIFDYAQKDFNASFMVTELVLLKRKHGTDVCEKIGLFRLPETEVEAAYD